MILILDFILIFLIFLLGIFSSLSDIGEGKVPNRLLLFFFLVAFPFRIFQIFLEKEFLFFLNFFFSILIGFLLWYWGIWGAADGKLFILYSFLIPLKFYPPFYFFPSLILLRNLFFPIFLFSLLQSLKDFPLILKKIKEGYFSFKKVIIFLKNFSVLFSQILIFSLFFGISQKFLEPLGKILFLAISIFFLFLVFKMKNQIFLSFLFLISFFSAFFVFENFFFKFLLRIALITFLFLFFRKWFSFYLRNYGFKKLPLSSLEEGLELPKIGNEKIFELLSEKKEKIKLGKEEIKKIKASLPENYQVTIYTTFPFSIFLLFAVLILFFQKFIIKR